MLNGRLQYNQANLSTIVAVAFINLLFLSAGSFINYAAIAGIAVNDPPHHFIAEMIEAAPWKEVDGEAMQNIDRV